ncbi:unnamed protein product [Discosporangium mesarthrocarpum]
MFSATMPPAVERMAKKYLRHPAIIGDEDTGKNRRIEQRVLWLTESQKKNRVIEILRGHRDDKARKRSVTPLFPGHCVHQHKEECRHAGEAAGAGRLCGRGAPRRQDSGMRSTA